MSATERNTGRTESSTAVKRLSGKTGGGVTTAQQMRTCPACNKEFTLDEYLDHVYDSDECYKAYLASEKKEMSKQ